MILDNTFDSERPSLTAERRPSHLTENPNYQSQRQKRSNDLGLAAGTRLNAQRHQAAEADDGSNAPSSYYPSAQGRNNIASKRSVSSRAIQGHKLPPKRNHISAKAQVVVNSLDTDKIVFS